MKTYEAIATRSQGWWSVEIPNVGGGIFTQGRSLTDAEQMARDAIASVLDVSIDTVSVRLRVHEAEMLLDEVAQARAECERAGEMEQETLATAARALVATMSQRDAAKLLGLSHQRISQLISGHAA